jgi:predicted nucleic acid-binding protein
MAIIDSNIIIDYLSGVAKAKAEIESHQRPGISIVTWMEVLVGAKDENTFAITQDFLSHFELFYINAEIAKTGVTIRRRHKIKLPDAVIWATALTQNTILVTRNTKDFPRQDPSVRIPYT